MTVVEDFSTATSLRDIVTDHPWVRRTRPFAHIVAGDVFTPDFYARLHEEVTAIHGDGAGFQRNLGNYDASAVMLDERYRDGALGVFTSRGWHDLIAGMWGIKGTGDVTATLHHHEPGGRSGWPHNDLAPTWFPGNDWPAEDEVRLCDESTVPHKTGPVDPATPARETMRAVSLLFYLGNPEWNYGDGGETAFFDSMSGAARGAYAAIPPVNNSLVMFECTPYSYHSFISNRLPRTSVVMWLHRRKEETVERWGEHNVVYW